VAGLVDEAGQNDKLSLQTKFDPLPFDQKGNLL
jgi:hypothetical protein